MDSLDVILTSLMVLTYAMIGLCLGSFSSAIAYRIAHHKSWIVDKNVTEGARAARSACPSCHHQLSVLDLVPVFSWVFLGGKCRYCETKISARYPLIEAGGAAAMIFFFCAGGEGLSLAAFVITLPFCLAFILLLAMRVSPPFYIYGLFFSNVFVLLYTVLWGK
jgi:leader peptidase (prepilin peptidase)/N-methyltransferase